MCRIDPEIECHTCGGRMYLNTWAEEGKEKWVCMTCKKEVKINEKGTKM
jgi:hypothetical protein